MQIALGTLSSEHINTYIHNNPEILNRLVNFFDDDILYAVVIHPKVHLDTLIRLINNPKISTKILIMIAASPKISIKELHKLVEHPNFAVSEEAKGILFIRSKGCVNL